MTEDGPQGPFFFRHGLRARFRRAGEYGAGEELPGVKRTPPEHGTGGVFSAEGQGCVQTQILSQMALPMAVVDTGVTPSSAMSEVRMPASSTCVTALSMAAASCSRPKL